MNCSSVTVYRQKSRIYFVPLLLFISLLSSLLQQISLIPQGHNRRFSQLQTSHTLRARLEPGHNLTSYFVEWRCVMPLTACLQCKVLLKKIYCWYRARSFPVWRQNFKMVDRKLTMHDKIL